MAIFLVAIFLCFQFIDFCSTTLQLPGVEKLRFHEYGCRVILKRGMNPQGPIFSLRGVHLTDCLSVCRRHANCLSGSYVKDSILRKSFCILAGQTAARDGVLHKVLDAVYFEFECLNDQKITKPQDLINHGSMSPLCGRPTDFQSKLQVYMRKRVLGGHQAQPYSVPWMGQVIRGRYNRCGVTLIAGGSMFDGSTMWAVSAAHCFTATEVGDTFRVDTRTFSFMFGAFDLRYPTPHIVIRNAQNIIIHPEYDFATDNDIALIKFDRQILSNDFVRPICLPLAKIEPKALDDCVSCGYGRTGDIINPPVPSCIPRNFMHGGLDLDSRRISSSKAHTGSSNSDSGGPFECNYKNSYKILFFASVSGLRSIGQPVVLNLHSRWIDEVISASKPAFTSSTNVKWYPERRINLQPCWGSFAKSCSALGLRQTG